MALFVGHDLGTSGNKAVLVDEHGRIVAAAQEAYALDRPRPGWAEQDPAVWWRAVAATTRRLLELGGADPREVKALTFAGQMLSLVPLDEAGRPTRPAVSWLDARADVEARLISRRLGGERVVALIAGAAPTGKDIVAKVMWLRRHEPEVFARTRALCDATGYLVARATGLLRADPTAVGATGVLAPGKRTWSRPLAWLTGFPLDKAPTVAACASVVGELTAEAARDLDLAAGTSVAMGLADIPAAAVGSGAVEPGDAHVYLGTSSWVGVTVGRMKSAPRAGIASVPAADEGTFLMIGESETAGACRDWMERLIGGDFEARALAAPAGAGGLLFLPWMYGERSPVPDVAVRGALVGLSLEHGAEHVARAVYEGTALNLRWIVDAMGGAGEPCPVLRATGGGARSDLWLQILADVTARPVERVAGVQLAGAVGAALVGAVAVGALAGVRAIKDVVRVERRFEPRAEHRALHERAYATFRGLYRPLSRAARALADPAR